jgi:hypothetical protein
MGINMENGLLDDIFVPARQTHAPWIMRDAIRRDNHS